MNDEKTVTDTLVEAILAMDDIHFPKRMVDEFKRDAIWIGVVKLMREHIKTLYDCLRVCPPQRIYITDPKIGASRRLSGAEYYQGAIEEALMFEDIPDRLINPKELTKETER